MVDFKGVINGYISDNVLDGYVTIENVREMIECVDKSILKSERIDEIDSFLCIMDLLGKNIYDLNDLECFKVVLASVLVRNPDVVVCKNCFCNLDHSCREELIILFTMLRRLNLCKFVICSNDANILCSICDYIVTDTVSGKVPDVYEEINENLPFSVSFSKRVQEICDIKIGYRTNNEDLMKDVYRYVK